MRPFPLPRFGEVLTDSRGYTWRVVMTYKIPGRPISKLRPRFAVRSKKAKQWATATTRTTQKAQQWVQTYPDERSEAYCVRSVMPATIMAMTAHRVRQLSGPVRVDVDLVYPRAQNRFRKADPDGRLMHIVKPDRDNAAGMIYDGMTRVGLLQDDCQICCGETTQWVGAIVRRVPGKPKHIGEKPHAWVVVSVPHEVPHG